MGKLNNMNSSFTRRAFLGGAGTLVFLPFMESLLPRQLRAATPTGPQRLLIYHVPCGMGMADFTPTATGVNYPLSPILAPLLPVQANVSVLSGVNNYAAYDNLNPLAAGQHARGMGTLSTCAHLAPLDPGNPNAVTAGTSVDQLFAQQLGNVTPVNSLQLGVRVDNDCDTNYPCSLIETVSFSDPHTPLMPQTDPMVVFNNFFKGPDASESAAETARRRAVRSSVLDGVMGQAKSLQTRLGKSDAAKLDQYFTSVRDLETSLAKTLPPACANSPGPAVTDQNNYQQLYKDMTTLMVLAFQCDLTRSISFSFGNGHSDHLYDFLGLTDVHHSYSHHGGDPVKIAAVTKINIFEMQVFSSLLQGLQAIPEGAGTVLDNSIVVLSSEITDGDAHDHDNVPLLLAGKGGGALKQGQHIQYPNGPDLASFWLLMLQTLGVPATHFGQGNVSTLIDGLT